MIQTPLNYSRNDKFLLITDYPRSVKEDPDIQKLLCGPLRPNTDRLEFYIYGSPVPEIKITPVDVPYMGHVFKTSSHVNAMTKEITWEFLIDHGYLNYWILWKWVQKFRDMATGITEMNETRPGINRTFKTIDEYSADINVFFLDEYDNRVMKAVFYGAFPIMIGGFKMNYQEGKVLTGSVTFAFQNFLLFLEKNVSCGEC